MGLGSSGFVGPGIFKPARPSGSSPTPPTSAQYVYLTDSDNGSVQRIDIETEAVVEIGTALGTSLRGIAVDKTNGFIYLCDNGGDEVLRMTLAGEDLTALFSMDQAYDIVLDVPNDVGYVCNNIGTGAAFIQPFTLSTGATLDPIDDDLLISLLSITQIESGGDLLLRAGSNLVRITLAGSASVIGSNTFNAFGGHKYIPALETVVYPNVTVVAKIDLDGSDQEGVIDNTTFGATLDAEWAAYDLAEELIYFYDNNGDVVRVANFAYEAVTTYTLPEGLRVRSITLDA